MRMSASMFPATASQSPRVTAALPFKTTSAFARDIAYPRSSASRSAAARASTTPAKGRAHDPVAEPDNLLHLDQVVPPRPPPVLKEASNRCRALEGADPRIRNVEHGVGSIETHERVKVVAASELKRPPRTLDQVGSRGLLRHVPQYPPGRDRPASLAATMAQR